MPPPPAPPLVLVAAPPQAAADDLREPLETAGFAVAVHRLGGGEPADFDAARAAVVAVGETVAAAAAHTRLWRLEAGDRTLPVLWVLPFPSADLTAAGLDAGADAVLARPVEPAVLAAQVRALVRQRRRADGLLAHRAEARELNGRLQQAYAELDRAFDLARRVQRAVLPRRLPAVGGVRFAVAHRPRSRSGGDGYEVTRLDEHHVGFWLADAGGTGSPCGGLIGLLLRQAVRLKEVRPDGYRLVPPGEAVAAANRELIALDLDPPPLVGLACGHIDARTGKVAVARGGLPPAVYVPADGPAEVWAGPGPFLGAFEADFPPQYGQLHPGDKLLLLTDGARPTGDPDPLPAIAERHRGLPAQAFVDAVARDALPLVAEPDDCTILAVEMDGERSEGERPA